MTAFAADLHGHAERRWGTGASTLTPMLDRLTTMLALIEEQPSVEPGRWPPAALPPARVPRFHVAPPPSGADLCDAGVAALAAGVARGSISTVALVEVLLARVAALQPSLEAWAALDGERARAAARQRDAEARAGNLRGALHGVPLGIKDIIDVAGLPTRANSTVRADAPPAADDAHCVALLRAAGALILGKTATTEFALSDPSGARNPWNTAHTPGGSSSGSAAAVAARMVPGALGTQTAGSVLRPAAFCGIVGFKPTTERVSRRGVLPLAWTLDHVGTLTRSVADTTLLYGAITAATTEDHPVARPRIGFAPGFLTEHTDEATRDALQSAAQRLARQGAHLEPLDLGDFGPTALAVHQLIMASEVAAYHLGIHGERLAELGPRLRTIVQSGALIPARALLHAQGLRRLLWQRWNAVFTRFDAVIVPAAPGIAPAGLESTGDASLNGPWSLLGVPACTLPVTVTAEGLPLGLQLVAPYGEDARLLAVAAWCEQMLDFHARPAG